MERRLKLKIRHLLHLNALIIITTTIIIFFFFTSDYSPLVARV